jgi:hypothetical protein
LKATGVLLLPFLLSIAFLVNVHPVSAYSPRQGDYFDYSEAITVNNGQGSYAGYTDQTRATGMEQMDSLKGSAVSTSYSYNYEWSDNQGDSTSMIRTSGEYTWSLSNYTYVNGTDNEVGYSKPTYIWFFMNSSLPVGSTFFSLNTRLTVLSKNYSLQLPTEGNRYVQTIETEGTGQYQRNDEYGVFNASYTWDEYFDPVTGYIVGYNYVEQDNGRYGSFAYIDNVYVTSTNYALASTSAPSAKSTTGLQSYLGYLLALALVIFIIVIALYVMTRRRRRESLPKHSPTPYTPPTPPSAPWESKVDLGSKPPQQVVIKEVAKVNCKYCGTLIPTTADKCPYCGGPRQ